MKLPFRRRPKPITGVPQVSMGPLFADLTDERFGRVLQPNIQNPIPHLERRAALTAGELERMTVEFVDAVHAAGGVDIHTVAVCDQWLHTLMSQQFARVEEHHREQGRVLQHIRAQQLANIDATSDRVAALTDDLSRVEATYLLERARLLGEPTPSTAPTIDTRASDPGPGSAPVADSDGPRPLDDGKAA